MENTQQIIKLFQKGLSVSKISKTLKITYTDVLQTLRNEGMDLSTQKTKFTSEQESIIIAEFEKGTTLQTISKIIGSSRMAVHCLLILRGFKIKEHLLCKKLSTEQKNEIANLYYKRKPIYEIAKQYNTGSVAIKRLLKEILPIGDFEKYRSRTYKQYDTHGTLSKEYYDKYLKKENEDVCEVCGNHTNFVSMSKGYNRTCSHACGAKLFRSKLKQDINKFNNFKNKVSKHRKLWWNNLSTTEAKIQKQKIKAGITHYISKLTKEEKQNIYGWVNKLSPAEKQNYMSNIMFKTGMYIWRKNATSSQLKEMVNKRRNTILRNRGLEGGLEYFNDFLMDEYKYYKREVYRMTENTYNKYSNIINSSNQPRSFGWQLDHKYSVSQGFIDKIKPEIISSVYNLQMLPIRQNNTKNYKCSITKEELIKLYEQDALQTRNI